jgi:signal transduction histidine kinase
LDVQLLERIPMMSPIRVLIVEPQPSDAEVLIYQLSEAGFACEWSRVESEPDYIDGLESAPDLILAECALPGFDAMRALEILRERDMQVPLIIVTDPINEAAAAACLQSGAADYLLKDRLARLGTAVRRGLELRCLRAEKEQAEIALRDSEALYHATLRSLTAHLAVLDHTGAVITVNKPWDDLGSIHSFLSLPDVRVGANYRAVCQAAAAADTDEARQVVEGIQAVLEGSQKRFFLEYTAHTPREERWFVLDITSLDSHRPGVVIAHRDITERKRAEIALAGERAFLARRIEERTADLSAANAELARTARLKDEFLANMSHELRTPLNVILGLSEALQENVYGICNERQATAVQGIEQSGRHLLMLINDILDLSKIGAGKLVLDVGEHTVNDICQASLQFVRQAAHAKQLTLTVAIDPTITTLQADGRRLKQILVNLLNNAVKFTPAGGRIGLEVTGDTTQQVVHMSVWDTGIGIAPTDLPQLFQPFVQLDSRLARQYDGTGLGLALVARMAELHGGSVMVTSTIGEGSQFTVSLPWRTTTADARHPDTPAPEEAGLFRTIPIRRALIVDDSPTATAILARYLSDLGVEAVSQPHGHGVIARAVDERPDVIILDILLPDMTGWEVLSELKADPRTQAIPILIASVTDDVVQGRALGAGACLVKPFTRQDVQHALEQLTNLGNNKGGHIPLSPRAARPATSGSPVILLVEDNEANITTLFDYLRAKGYQIVVARDGAEALAHAREVRPALILMDIQLPGMDGLEATRHIRAEAALAMVPIIALTALVMPGDRERCFAAGANAYLSKPVRLRDLHMAIEAQLAPH